VVKAPRLKIHCSHEPDGGKEGWRRSTHVWWRFQTAKLRLSRSIPLGGVTGVGMANKQTSASKYECLADGVSSVLGVGRYPFFFRAASVIHTSHQTNQLAPESGRTLLSDSRTNVDLCTRSRVHVIIWVKLKKNTCPQVDAGRGG
jgi:hypothetical protein